MSLTPEQYLALSTLAYETLSSSDDISRCIGDIVQKMDRDRVDSLELRALSSLSSWVLVNAYTSPSGMSAIAVQNPKTKEVVFVYRGTDAIEKNFTVGIKDWFMDLKIAVGANLTVDNGQNQFVDAQNFYYNTIQKLGGASSISERSFTGHSLGGGLAQYMAYVTAGKYKTVTFDAVGIGQALPGVNPRDYDNTVTDYVNRDDFIGLYGVQLGREVYIENKGSQQYRDRNNSISAGQRLMLQAIIDSAKAEDVPAGVKWAFAAMSVEVGRAVQNGMERAAFDSHRQSSLLNDEGKLGTPVPTPTR